MLLEKAIILKPMGERKNSQFLLHLIVSWHIHFESIFRQMKMKFSSGTLTTFPVISDNMLLYRIWLPFATEFTQLPSLTLSRFAYAAQSEGVVFYEKLRNTAAELEQTRNIDLINTTEVARRKIEDILLRESGGNLDSVTDEVVAGIS